MITIPGPAMLADEALGITKTNLGDIVGSGATGALVGKPVWGPLCDRIGGRPTLLIGIILTGLLTGIYGFSPNAVAFASVYYLPISIFSIEFGGRHSATRVSLLDAVGLGASASFGFVGGRLADSAGGWDSFMSLIVILVLIAMISMFAFMHAESRPARSS